MSDEPKTTRFHVKGFIALVLMVAFLTLAISGICLYISPQGRIARWTDWTLLGLGRHDWVALHMNAAVLFLVAAVFHLIWNWKIFWSYLKQRTAARVNLKLELALALVIGLIVVGGTALDVPPFHAMFQLKRTIGDCWAEKAADMRGGPGQGRGRGPGQEQGQQYRGGRQSGAGQEQRP